jgi:hypothetical protein
MSAVPAYAALRGIAVLDSYGQTILPNAKVAFNQSGFLRLGRVKTARCMSEEKHHWRGVWRTWLVEIEVIEPNGGTLHTAKVRNPDGIIVLPEFPILP